MSFRFNIRVYGIWLRDGKLLVNEERIAGQKILKFPGGGLEFGEGTLEALKREWQEEFQMEISILDHFYTTDFFQPSAFDDSQVISIYYLVEGKTSGSVVNHEENAEAKWLSLTQFDPDWFSLPIDRVVARLLLDSYRSKR